MLDYSKVKGITIPEGNATAIDGNGTLLWSGKEYTEIEYISLSNAYFDTGVVPSGDKWTYEARMYASTWGTSSQYYYFAVRETAAWATVYAPIHVSGGYRMWVGNTKLASAGGVKNKWYTIKSEVQNGSQQMWLDGILKVTGEVAFYTKYTRPLFFFSCNMNGTRSGVVAGRVSWLKIHKGDVLVRDFVAAKRNADGVYGLFDKVEGKFYAKAGNTGTVTGSE